MQKIVISLVALVFFFLFLPQDSGGEDPFRPIRNRSDEIYRLSQEMTHHGEEGHTHEIVLYGEKAIEQIETLIKQIQSSKIDRLNQKKEGIIASVNLTLKKTKEAIRLGKVNDASAALKAARSASFQAKKSRQQIQALQ